MRIPEISRARALAYAVVILALLAIGGRFLLGSGRGAAPVGPAGSLVLVAETAAPRTVLVDVVGAVRRPGVYELEEGSRVLDAVRKAGGPKAKAAIELVNLAAPVADGEQIVVPVKPPAGTPPVAAAAASGGPATAAPVHLSTATLEQLDSLPGVGPVTAQKILDYRQAHGAFQSLDELDAIPGIGPARLGELKKVLQL